jgi:hypothetical protein
MHNTKFLSFLIPLCLIFCSFCNTDESEPNITTRLTSGVWTYKELLDDQQGTGVFTNILFDCESDDTWHFKTNGKLDYSEESTLCDPDFGAINATSDWNLLDNDTKIHIKLGEEVILEEIDYKIVVLDDHNLEIHRISADGVTREKIKFTR